MMQAVQNKIDSSKNTEKKRVTGEKKFTAKAHQYQLQKNASKKVTPLIDLFELGKKLEYTNSDIILAIIEITKHSDIYNIPSGVSFKSNSFWEEIVQYNELKRLFQFFRPETIKKYYRLISYNSKIDEVANVIKTHKKLLDEKKPKLLTIITGIQNFVEKTIKSFTDFIVNPHKYLNLGLPSENLTGRKRVKEIEKVFKGENVSEEIKKFLSREGPQTDLHLEEKDEIKRLSYGLRTISNKEKRKLFKFTEEDKFVFSCIDNIVDTISKEFKDIPKEFIINALKINTLNLSNTYEYLKKPHNSQVEKLTYNSGDDHVLKYMKGTNFYKELLDIHGAESVADREYFLSQ
jgi:hypothetical protein